jgi:hypothetical protein
VGVKKMSNKQEKKLRQLVRRNQRKIAENMQPTLVNQSWDCFFQTISEMKLKYRIKLAWKIIRAHNIRVEEQKKLIKG